MNVEFVRTGLFRTRLAMLILLLVVPTFVLVMGAIVQRQESEKERAKERAITTAKLAAAKEAYFIRQARQLLATMTEFPFLVQLPDRSASEKGLGNLKLISPDFEDFGLLEKDGTLFCHTLGSNATRTVNWFLFEKVMKTKGFSSATLERGAEGPPVLQFGYPVLKTNEGVVRVMYASLKTSLLSETLKDVSLPEGGVVNVFDADGKLLVSHPQPGQEAEGHSKTTKLVADDQIQKEGAFERAGADGTLRVYAVSAVKDHDQSFLFTSVGIPRREFFAQADQRLIGSSLFVLAVVAFLVAIAWTFSSRVFLQPVAALVNAAEKMTKGDLGARTGLPKGESELHILAQRFDEMAESLERRQSELEKANLEIKSHNVELEKRVAERTSALQEMNGELEAFSYSVSHDLRAPLRHMNGFAEMLLTDPELKPNDRAQRRLELITKSAKQMGTLIDDLLSFSKMGRQQLSMRAVRFDQIVTDVIAETASVEPTRSVEWKISPLPEIHGDAALLRLVWTNLISNALKYTREREQTVIAIETSETKEEIVFSVTDNGAGFDMQYAGRLFGVFQRLHSDDEFEGTGIGLANVRRIVARHGGRTWAEGKVGEGATFSFSLPKELSSRPPTSLCPSLA